jgi:PD-(D/E)XK nuclease superfamily
MPQTVTDGALSWQRLAVKNAHPRDALISFEEETHTYTIKGEKEGWISCTGFIHGFFQEFNADVVISKMMASSKWPENKYYGKTVEEIKKIWDDNRDEASGAGTRMHLDIEHYNNAEPVGNLEGDDWKPQEGAEWSYFLEYERKHRIRRGFVPYRTEWLVFKEDIKLAGSIDMVYKKPDGTFAIYDWKRAKEMKYENKFQSGLPPLDHLPDTNYWHYSLQLNVYRRMIEELYGCVVSEMALVVLHPNNETYKVIALNRMDDEVTAMFETRRKVVEGGA